MRGLNGARIRCRTYTAIVRRAGRSTAATQHGARARRSALTLLGWRIIHLIWSDLTRRPQAVIDSIKDALAGDSPEQPDGRTTGPAAQGDSSEQGEAS